MQLVRKALGLAVAAMIGGSALCAAGARAAGSGSISGVAFQDTNRNGIQDPGEVPFSGHVVYLYDSAGTYLKNSTTDSSGHYSLLNLSDGDYKLAYSATSWNTLKDGWVPTTTGSLNPTISLHLAGMAAANFGWRAIVRSTDAAAPLSSATGPDGLRVNSYDDVVSAQQVYDALHLANIGAEAPRVVVRFDYATNSVTSYSGGSTTFSATSDVTYRSWLDHGDITLDHEYGHAWTLYRAYVVQQDSTLSGYLQVRGLLGDSRLESSHAWDRREMIAEDYRQLFGSANGASAPQENTAIPAAAAVPGLKDYLAGPFTGSAGGTSTTKATLSSLAVNPAPVKTTGTVSFSASAATTVSVSILDSAGNLVRTLATSAAVSAGTNSFVWDRKNSAAQRVKSGTYTAKVVAQSDGTSITTTFSVS